MNCFHAHAPQMNITERTSKSLIAWDLQTGVCMTFKYFSSTGLGTVGTSLILILRGLCRKTS